MAFKFGIEIDGVFSALPPPMQLVLLSEGAAIGLAVGFAGELGIADLVADGPKSSDEIAQATSMHPDSVYRLLRLLSCFGVFSEVEPGRFAQSSLSEPMRTDAPGSMRSWVRMGNIPVMWSAFADGLHSMKTGEPTFERVAGMEMFEYMAANPQESAIFNEGMTAFAQAKAAAVVDAYDFSEVEKIVDVGGGHGMLISAILQANPHLEGILFDQPHVAEGARSTLDAAGVADRCEIVGGDFFKSVPKGGDTYVLSWIIHDWGHDRAVEILESCRRAMDPKGRLLLVEAVVPAGDEPHLSKIFDFVMLVVLGGRERTAEQYGDLLRAAGFELSRVVPTAAAMSVIEAVPSP